MGAWAEGLEEVRLLPKKRKDLQKKAGVNEASTFPDDKCFIKAPVACSCLV